MVHQAGRWKNWSRVELNWTSTWQLWSRLELNWASNWLFSSPSWQHWSRGNQDEPCHLRTNAVYTYRMRRECKRGPPGATSARVKRLRSLPSSPEFEEFRSDRDFQGICLVECIVREPSWVVISDTDVWIHERRELGILRKYSMSEHLSLFTGTQALLTYSRHA